MFLVMFLLYWQVCNQFCLDFKFFQLLCYKNLKTVGSLMELLYNAIFLEDSSSEIEQHVPYFPVYMRCTFFPIKSWNISLGIICSRSGSRVSFVLCCTSCLLMLHYSCLQTASYTLVCLVYQKIRYFDSLFTWYSILDVRFQSHLWRSRTL